MNRRGAGVLTGVPILLRAEGFQNPCQLFQGKITAVRHVDLLGRQGWAQVCGYSI